MLCYNAVPGIDCRKLPVGRINWRGTDCLVEQFSGNQLKQPGLDKPEIFQAVRLNKYLEFQRDVFIHRKGAKNAKV